tara:strand:- start:2308 stop:2556 length:249 start_codon:yes stop_codon:yes gene_type:complete
MLSVLFLLLLISSHLTGFTQSTLIEKETIELNTLLKRIDGTYQIQMIDTRALPRVEIRIAKEIEKKRHQTEYQNINCNYKER